MAVGPIGFRGPASESVPDHLTGLTATSAPRS